MSSNTSGEGEIRKNIINADLLDCMVVLPSQLFYNTMIPACLWFIAREKKNHKFRDRRGNVLFIDARKLGTMVDRRHRELSAEEIEKIADTYHAWRDESDLKYRDILGFCKSATLVQIKEQHWILTPGRYVGAKEEQDDNEAFQERMMKLTTELAKQMNVARELDSEIQKKLSSLGFSL